MLQKSFYDLDEEIEKEHGPIKSIFKEKGEQAFRELERGMLKDLAQVENAVVATGGGTPVFFDNMLLMKENGITLFIDTPIEIILERLNLNKPEDDRPLLEGQNEEDIRTLYKQRLKIYKMADIIWKSDCSETSVANIVAAYMRSCRD